MTTMTRTEESTSVSSMDRRCCLRLTRADLETRFPTGLGQQLRIRQVPAGATDRVLVVSCYEADCDGFWSHRWLGAHAASNQVLSRDSQRDQ